MKKLYLIPAFIVLVFETTFGQDEIIKSNGDKLSVQIVEVHSDEIVYKVSEMENLLYTISKGDVTKIKFANGTEEIFVLSARTDIPNMSIRREELYFMGRRDADRHFNGNGAMWGTFGVTFLLVPAGLVTGIVVGAVPPNIEKTAPDFQLLQEIYYRGVYQKGKTT